MSLALSDESSLSRWDRLLGYMSFAVPYFFVSVFTFGLPLGLILFPRSFGLCVTLPYWTYTLTVGRYEVHDGYLRSDFSQNFVIFRWMRKLLRMTVAPLPHTLIQAERSPNAQFVFAMFPHGVWADYHVSMAGLWPALFPNIQSEIRSLNRGCNQIQCPAVLDRHLTSWYYILLLTHV